MRSLLLGLAPLLVASAAAAADQPPAKAATTPSDPDKVVCKRQTEIGSLVAAKKVCMTKAEWAAKRAEAQSDTRRMQETTGGPQ